MKSFLILVVCFIGFMTHGVALAQVNDEIPVDITSDTLVYLQLENKAIFDGHVHVVHGTLTLQADHLTVSYNTAQENVDSIVATGHVVVVHDHNKATGDQAIYNPETGKVELTGNVNLWREDNMLTGEKLIYDPVTGTMKLSNSEKGRVKARFSLNKKDETE